MLITRAKISNKMDISLRQQLLNLRSDSQQRVEAIDMLLSLYPIDGKDISAAQAIFLVPENDEMKFKESDSFEDNKPDGTHIDSKKLLSDNAVQQVKSNSTEIKQKREHVLEIIRHQNKLMTSSEIENLYCADWGLTFANKNFARNTVMKFTNEGVLKRLLGLGKSPYHYGLADWFNTNGTLKEDYKTKE